VPTRNAAGAAPRGRGRPRRQVSRAKSEQIRTQRARLVVQLTALCEQHGVSSSSLLARAQQLLTRWWSPADWVGREKLLKTAEWLIRLEQRRGREARRLPATAER
jgi:hypothetical protein